MPTINTGSRRIVCNVWTDEAREAAAEARKGGGGKGDDWDEKSGKASSKAADKQGARNYANLSPAEKKQFAQDWTDSHKKAGSTPKAKQTSKDAYAKSDTAAESGKPKDHAAAANAHNLAAQIHEAVAKNAKTNPTADANKKLASDHRVAEAQHTRRGFDEKGPEEKGSLPHDRLRKPEEAKTVAEHTAAASHHMVLADKARKAGNGSAATYHEQAEMAHDTAAQSTGKGRKKASEFARKMSAQAHKKYAG